MDENPRRHYIIVVHGIGEQKLNETTAPLIHRFAEVRNNRDKDFYRNLLPAHLSAQSVRRRGLGHGWSEFEGIAVNPRDPNGQNKEFDGTPATDSLGRNFRFVDLHWAHILRDLHKDYASSTESWANALRYRFRTTAPESLKKPWQEKLLHQLLETALPLKKLLSWYNPELAKKIYDDFLGDVHLYGDFARTRGRAVRHFHVILDEIHLRDLIDWGRNNSDRGGLGTYKPPIYTVIAHSLGSIMSFDALVYAHAKKTIREAKASTHHVCPSLPFLGYADPAEGEEDTWRSLMEQLAALEGHNRSKREYLQEWEEQKKVTIPPLKWRDHIQHFITLGSPIDKYHVLWWHNYYHMGLGIGSDQSRSQDWFEERRADKKIVHYNLCDEQDPVGHKLDVAQGTEHYGKFFVTDEEIPAQHRDVVFRRYAVPGLAHVKYWEDSSLFKGILQEVIDRTIPHGSYFYQKSFWEKDKSLYGEALKWAYFRIPIATAVITFMLLAYGLSGLLPCVIDRLTGCNFGFTHIVSLLASLLLWTCPKPGVAYSRETSLDPEERKQEPWYKRWRPRRSIFAHLVGGSIEWRRVLLQLSKRESAKDKERVAPEGDFEKGGFWKYGRKYYAGAILVVAIPIAAVATGFSPWPPDPGMMGLFLFGLTYFSVMLYVLWVYWKAKQ